VGDGGWKSGCGMLGTRRDGVQGDQIEVVEGFCDGIKALRQQQ
ncbi:hypothetical protein A2U01_0065984, partial [Trifolium medium]|nr:hypothetical protein [Trifolium medium]